jgi:uncharacterized RDD family membrane protein YckC
MAEDEGEEEGQRDARRSYQSPFVPLVLLLTVLAIVGYLNTNLVEPYTGPRAVADDQGAYVFYDSADKDARLQDRSFFLRKTLDGRRYEKAQRVEGSLVSTAILNDEYLVCLFPDFFSIYARPRGLDREWSGAATPETLGFEPRLLARLGNHVYTFGTSPKEGTLRAARLESESSGSRTTWRLAPLEGAHVEKAAETPAPEAVERSDHPEEPTSTPPPPIWTAAEDGDGTLALLYRVARERAQEKGARSPLRAGETPPGIVRIVRFDGTAFIGSRAGAAPGSEIVALDEDLTAFAATAVSTSASGTASVAPLTTEVLVFGTRRTDAEPEIVAFALEGSHLRELEKIPYKRGGFFEDRGVVSLAAVSQHGRILLFAQIGGAVKVIVKEGGKWGEWIDVARMPTEALALVYLYMGSLALLAAIMFISGIVALERRLRERLAPRDLDAETAGRFIAEALGERAPAAPAPLAARRLRVVPDDAGENDASIPDRLVAFGIDASIVFGMFLVARQSFQIEVPQRANEDPTRVLAFIAWGTLAMLAYLAIFEGFFGRTPGKRLLGLEIRGIDGKPPSVLARIYRNVFRIELIFLATSIQIPLWSNEHAGIPVPLIALLIMIATPRTQRPGDLVARTVVVRARDPNAVGEADGDAAAAAEDEERSA